MKRTFLLSLVIVSILAETWVREYDQVVGQWVFVNMENGEKIPMTGWSEEQ